MITFINKKDAPVLVCINNEEIIISNYEECKYDTNASSVEFIVKDGDKSKPKFVGYIFLVFLGLIGVLLDITDSSYLHFRNSLSLPVKVNLSNICKDKDIIVEITDTKQDGRFCIITANATLNTELIIDSEEIDNQYKAYQKECFAVFFIPVLLVAAVSIIILFAKNIIAYIAVVFIIAISFYAWFCNHKKNIKYIENIKKASFQN